ncbi:hypothetical protein JZ751_028387, partial [Albula glossodonta]
MEVDPPKDQKILAVWRSTCGGGVFQKEAEHIGAAEGEPSLRFLGLLAASAASDDDTLTEETGWYPHVSRYQLKLSPVRLVVCMG